MKSIEDMSRKEIWDRFFPEHNDIKYHFKDVEYDTEDIRDIDEGENALKRLCEIVDVRTPGEFKTNDGKDETHTVFLELHDDADIFETVNLFFTVIFWLQDNRFIDSVAYKSGWIRAGSERGVFILKEDMIPRPGTKERERLEYLDGDGSILFCMRKEDNSGDFVDLLSGYRYKLFCDETGCRGINTVSCPSYTFGKSCIIDENMIDIDSNIRDDHREILLCLHGFGGDKESSVIAALRRELDTNGIGVAAFDWPAHGANHLKDTYFEVDYCLAYLGSVVKKIKSKWDKPISCFATSFGGYMAALYIQEKNPFRKIILRSPAINMDKVFRKLISAEDFAKLKSGHMLELGYERKIGIGYCFYAGLIKHRISSLQDTSSIMIIQGDKDDVVDLNDTKGFADLNNLKLVIFEGADHRYKNPGELDRIVDVTRRFLKENAADTA